MLVKLTHENIDQEHICCAISNNKDIQVMSKKSWLKDRLDEGLYIAGFQVQIAAAVRILMLSAFTAGVMWQALSSKDNAVELTAMLMLPFHRREFVFSYVGMLGAYTVPIIIISAKDTDFDKTLTMDLNAYSVKKDGKAIELTEKEFEILKLLLQNPKKVYTKEQMPRIVRESV